MPAPSRGRLRALDLPPGPAFVAALEEAWAVGDAVLPLDPAAPAATRDRLCAALGVGEPVDVADAALVIATSGSTGEPKGAVLTHAALAASADATHARIGLEAGDRWLSCLPWHHIGGLQVLLRARRTGTPVVVHERFDVARVAAEADVTLTSLVPTQLQRLLDAGVDLRRFRAILLGVAAAPALLARARAAGAPVVTTYGMSETSGGCVYDGRPLDGVEVDVEHDGRIRVRGPVVMAGYRDRSDLTAAALVDGWLRTSDVGDWDGQRLTVRGRIDDVIVTGGENVVAGEVAALLAAHPAVRDAVVVGAPDAEWGQRVAACVVLDADVDPAALRSWVRDRSSAAAAPRQVLVLDELPLLPSGKPDRQRLLRLAAERWETPPDCALPAL